jgi:hypothetical protein
MDQFQRVCLSMALQVAFVAHQQHWEVFPVLDPLDGLLQSEHIFQTLPTGHRENEQEAVPTPQVFFSHFGILFLARRVHN